jgi:hypothetical protein
MPHITDLHKQVKHFKHWADSADQCSGEWECDYEQWHDLWAAAIETIDVYRDGLIPTAVADDLLYALARDNECEHIRENLLVSPELIATLAKRVITMSDADAKWQIAISVAAAKLPNAADLLRPFLTDDDEYVRRRSLMAFAPFAPKESEAIALKNLDDAFEYTRITALHVLHSVQSPNLSASLDRFATDPNEYVRRNVQELRIAQREGFNP